VIAVGLVGLANAQTSPDRGKLIEDAKKEGKVVFYTGASANDGNALKVAFERKYPFLKMEYFRAGKDKLLGKYLTEVRNNTFLPDVYQGSVFPLAALQQKGLLARYQSPEREAIHENLRDNNDYWAPVILNAMTITYNTRLVKGGDIPKSYTVPDQRRRDEEIRRADRVDTAAAAFCLCAGARAYGEEFTPGSRQAVY
jgi:iron(III) transport system substrate-binding protein